MKVEDGRRGGRISWECNAEISAWTSSSSPSFLRLFLSYLSAPISYPRLSLSRSVQIAITNITHDHRLDDFSSLFPSPFFERVLLREESLRER